MSFLPLGLAGIVAGPLVDRWDRRRVMVAANAVASLSTLAVAALHYAEVLVTWHLYLALFVNGVANAFITPAFDASVPLLVPKEQLGRASGMAQMITALEMVIGPALAGVLLSAVGLGVIFIVDFATFAASVAALALAVVPRPPKDATSAAAPTSLLGELASAWNYLRQHRPLLLLLALVTWTMFLMPGFGFALCTPLVLSFADEQAAGLVLASFGFGALASGILLAGWGGPQRRMTGMLVALIGAGFAMAVIGWRESVLVTAFGVACIGASFTFLMGLSRVIWQVKVPPAFLGRVFGLRLVFGVFAQCLGLMLAAPLAQQVFEPLMAAGGVLAASAGAVLGVGPGRGMGLMYAAIGLIAIVTAVVCAAAPSVRRLEDRVPDALEEGVAGQAAD